jgi:predicted  nucleic acid-binding Zn-ribbon protein
MTNEMILNLLEEIQKLQYRVFHLEKKADDAKYMINALQAKLREYDKDHEEYARQYEEECERERLISIGYNFETGELE